MSYKLAEINCYVNKLNLYGHLDANEYAQIKRRINIIYLTDDNNDETDELLKEITALYLKLN